LIMGAQNCHKNSCFQAKLVISYTSPYCYYIHQKSILHSSREAILSKSQKLRHTLQRPPAPQPRLGTYAILSKVRFRKKLGDNIIPRPPPGINFCPINDWFWDNWMCWTQLCHPRKFLQRCFWDMGSWLGVPPTPGDKLLSNKD
jgi:hypothetical protein